VGLTIAPMVPPRELVRALARHPRAPGAYRGWRSRGSDPARREPKGAEGSRRERSRAQPTPSFSRNQSNDQHRRPFHDDHDERGQRSDTAVASDPGEGRLTPSRRVVGGARAVGDSERVGLSGRAPTSPTTQPVRKADEAGEGLIPACFLYL
jgi:hypothetical protein